MRLFRIVVITALVLASGPILFSQNTPSSGAGGIAQILTADDVRAILTVAATALADNTMAAAVVAWSSRILRDGMRI